MKINGNTLNQELKAVTGTTGAELVNMSVNKGKVKLSASNDGRTYIRVFESDNPDSFQIALRPAELSKMLKGNVTFLVKGSSLHIISPTYKVDTVVEPYTPPDIDTKSLKKISLGESSAIAASVAATSIRAYTGDLLYGYVCNDSGFMAATWDNLHFAMYYTKVVKGNSNLRTKAGDIMLLLSAVPPDESGLKLSLGDGLTIIQSASAYLAMPTIQPEPGAGLPELSKFRASFQKPCCEVQQSELIEALDRANSVLEPGGSVQVTVTKDKITLTVGGGKTKYTEIVGVKASSGQSFTIDPSMWIECLAKHADETVMVGVKDNFVWMKTSEEEHELTSALLTSQ